MKGIFDDDDDDSVFDQIAEFFNDIIDAIRDFFENLFGN